MPDYLSRISFEQIDDYRNDCANYDAGDDRKEK